MSAALNYYFGATKNNPTIVTTSTYQMLTGDGYVNGQPTANSTYTLPDCIGQTGATYHINYQETGVSTLTIKNAVSTEPINGTDYSTSGLLVLSGPGTVAFTDVANPSVTAGCHWDYSSF